VVYRTPLEATDHRLLVLADRVQACGHDRVSLRTRSMCEALALQVDFGTRVIAGIGQTG
jgi:hypothetical protein